MLTYTGPVSIVAGAGHARPADRAFARLEKAVQYGDPGRAELLVENLFDRIHSDPRWAPFLQRTGEALEQLARIPFHVSVPQAPNAAGTSAGVEQAPAIVAQRP